MCAPMAVMAVAAVASAAMTAYGVSQQADAQKQSANYQAQVAANNATLAGYQRSAALQQGESQAQQSMLQQSQLESRQRAEMAGNGVDLSSGSAIDQLATTRFLGQQDVNQIQSNAARQAWGYEVQGSNYTADSGLNKWKADSINPAGMGAMAGGASLLSSASTYAMAKR